MILNKQTNRKIYNTPPNPSFVNKSPTKNSHMKRRYYIIYNRGGEKKKCEESYYKCCSLTHSKETTEGEGEMKRGGAG